MVPFAFINSVRARQWEGRSETGGTRLRRLYLPMERTRDPAGDQSTFGMSNRQRLCAPDFQRPATF